MRTSARARSAISCQRRQPGSRGRARRTRTVFPVHERAPGRLSDQDHGRRLRGLRVRRLCLARQGRLGASDSRPRPHPEIHPQHVGQDNLLSLVAIGRELTLTSVAITIAQFRGGLSAGRQRSLAVQRSRSPRNDNPACRRLLGLARSMAGCNAARAADRQALICSSSVLTSQNCDRAQQVAFPRIMAASLLTDRAASSSMQAPRLARMVAEQSSRIALHGRSSQVGSELVGPCVKG